MDTASQDKLKDMPMERDGRGGQSGCRCTGGQEGRAGGWQQTPPGESKHERETVLGTGCDAEGPGERLGKERHTKSILET